MSDKSTKRIFLGMPGYGRQTEAAGRAFWNASRQRFIHREQSEVNMWNEYRKGSLLASNFNQLWCTALNMVNAGQQLDYWAMLHDDVGPMACGPDNYWLDMLIDELEANNLDVLSVAVPIKDSRGLTSMALHKDGNNWIPKARLSMHDIFKLPETFTSDDLGEKLLINTGCFVVKWNQDWCRKVHFEINDSVVFNRAANAFQAMTEPEDWFFSRLCHEQGVKIGATRKIKLHHRGEMDFTNEQAWGSNIFDLESVKESPVPAIDREGFRAPYDIPGWLTTAEGKALWRMASGARVLEIGSYCGLSTACIAQAAEHVTAVDYFDGRGTASPMDTRPVFDAAMERYGVAHKVAVCHPDAAIPLPRYDWAFIDGAHNAPAVRADICKALEVLKPNGLLVFHDYGNGTDEGVVVAVNELLAAGAELVSRVDSLAVVRPPAAIPMEV